MQSDPSADRPHVPGYGIPTDLKGTLDWSFVEERMKSSRNYWIGTTGPAGKPHVVPVWGVWLDGKLCCGGGPDTRWSRNLASDPRVVIHLESGDEAVIMEGTVEDRVTSADDPRLTTVDDAYEVKYKMRHGPSIWVLRPHVVFAWTEFPKTTSRWRFPS